MMRLSILLCLLAPFASAIAEEPSITVGSKNFTENVVLGELTTLLLEHDGVSASHRGALGGTRILFNALRAGEIDLYVEYSGTLTHEILAAEQPRSPEHVIQLLAVEGLKMSRPLGFANNYALGIREERAQELSLTTISDLRAHPDLVLRFSNEFMERADGWPALRERYRLPQRDVLGVEHDLAYRGLAAGDVDVTELYTTDAEIAYYGLRVLSDDEKHFPQYDAVILYRDTAVESEPRLLETIRRLELAIDVPAMIRMNARVKLEGATESQAAAEFLLDRFKLQSVVRRLSVAERIWNRTVEHLVLVAISLALALLIALPLGVLAARRPFAGQAILAIVGIAQTIPALALLVFMIPLLGIGSGPAVVALFVYSLLPIVRNTHAGLVGIPRALRESAQVLGLSDWTRLLRIEAPLALPSILAGIKTAVVINIGAATLGALIGAGGYGQPILTGIRLDDVGLILQGAIPAALMALAAQGGFDLLERAVVSPGLRAATVFDRDGSRE
jgi:osmoprotectant transport system permease protein